MIVEITSCAPTVAFRIPAIPAQSGARERRRRRCRGVTCSQGSSEANDEPSQTAKIVPTMYWPWPPMLNIPQRNANATASAVRTIGVVKSSVCCRFVAATEPVSHGNHMCAVANGIRAEWLPTWKNQPTPVPVKIAW